MKRFYLSTAIAVFFINPAYGQEEDRIIIGIDCYNVDPSECPARQDQVITIGQRIGGTYTDTITSPVSIITESEILARNNSYVADLLRTIPSASVNRSGSAGSLTQLRLRGSEGNHVLVLVDGVEVSNPNTGEFDFSNLRGADIVKIEVLRGEQSALWGSDAIGGVVNIITRAGAKDQANKASIKVGSFDTIEGQISAVIPFDFMLIPVGDAALSLNGNYFKTGGYDVSGLGGEKDAANSRGLNVGLNGIKIGALKISGKLSTTKALSGFDVDTDFNGRLDNTDAELATESAAGRLSGRFEMLGFDHLLNLSLNSTEQNTTGTSFQNDTEGKRTQLNWAAKKKWGAHNLTLLAETEKENFSNFGGTGGFQNQSQSIRNHAIAADYRTTLLLHKNPVTLSASARQDFNDRFSDRTTWRVGAGYGLELIGGRIRASIGRGVKNPSMTELFGFFPGSFISNPNLIPETSIGYDMGYDQKIGNFNLSIDYFHSNLESEILTVFNPDFTSTVRNSLNNSKREGVEIEGRGALGDALFLRASASLLNAKENGVREVRRPEFLASATVTWRPISALSFALSADHTGNQIDVDFSSFSRAKLPAFTLVGLNVRYSVNDAITVSLRGENLLDEKYQEVVGYHSQGRGIYAGLSADF